MKEEFEDTRHQIAGWGGLIMAHLSRQSGDTGWAIVFGLFACWMFISPLARLFTGFWSRVWKR